MVRPERIHRIRAIGLHQDKEWFITTIHKLGCLHIENVPSKIKESKEYAKLTADVPLKGVDEVADVLMRVNFLADVFDQAGTEKKTPPKIPASFSLRSVVQDAREEIAVFEVNVARAADELERIEQSFKSNALALRLREKFELEFSVEKIEQSTEVQIAHGRMLKKDFDEYSFSKEDKKNMVLLVEEAGRKIYQFIAIYHKTKESEVFATLKALNAERDKTPLPTKTASKLREERKQLLAQKKDVKFTLQMLAGKHGAEVAFLQRLLTAAKERAEIATQFGKSEKTFCVEAYIPSRKLHLLEKKLTNQNIILEAGPAEDAPVLLKNPPYVRAFERITSMFGVPQYNSVDPTLFVSMFFPFFFGFMLSDVGYGGMVLLAALVFYIVRSRHEAFKDVATIAAACGTLTVVFGTLFGSFFGSLVRIPTVWVDPFKESMTILAVAIGVGIIHANLGILISAISNIRSGEWRKLLTDNGSLWALQLAAVFFYLRQPVIGGGLVAISALLLIIKSSLFGIMEISGFVGLILSYARILALSLATGGIALAVNIIAGQMLQLGAIGMFLAMIIILGGHLFNFVLNIIGSTVNAARLHFVEFFSLFFIEGGKKFIPFRIKQ